MHPQSQSNGVIAQLVEQRTENPCVPGSIPGDTTIPKGYRNVAQLVAHYVRDVGVGRSSRLIPTRKAKIEAIQSSLLFCQAMVSQREGAGDSFKHMWDIKNPLPDVLDNREGD